MIRNKKWEYCLKGELLLLILFYLICAGTNSVRQHSNSTIMIAYSVILGILLVLDLLKNHSQKLTIFSRWLEIIILPIMLSMTWESALHDILSQTNSRELIISIFVIIFLLMFLPVSVVAIGQVKNTIGRIIAVNLLFVATFYSEAINIRPSFYAAFINSGLLTALTFFVAAIFIAKNWGFAINPNLKWQKSVNWSFVTLTILLLLNIWFIFWNQYCASGNNLLSILFKVQVHPFHPTLKIFFIGLEAAISEEICRYLTILALLVGLINKKNRLELTIVLSAVVFGLMHFTNFGFQSFAATLDQAIYAFAVGLLFAVEYLYTGKLWVPMIFHFANDFINNSIYGGVTSNTWSGSINDWLVLLISVVVPALITTWMSTGRRKQMMSENTDRLLSNFTS